MIIGGCSGDPLPNQKTAPVEAAPEVALWRAGENDGINSLYLQLRLMGYGGTYVQFRQTARRGGDYRSVASLAALSSRFGFGEEARTLTFAELKAATGPIILFAEPDGIGSGRFWLYQSSTDRTTEVFDGSTVTWQQFTNDDFQHAWTGYALICVPHATAFTICRRVALGVVAFAFLMRILMMRIPRPPTS